MPVEHIAERITHQELAGKDWTHNSIMTGPGHVREEPPGALVGGEMWRQGRGEFRVTPGVYLGPADLYSWGALEEQQVGREMMIRVLMF